MSVCVCVFDGKHSDQTVLNKLPELITERGEEERMREEGKRGVGRERRLQTEHKKKHGDVCF